MSPAGIVIYNNLTAREETFEPLEPGKVKMYVCGITPYDESHLGHARCYVFFDTVRRFLAHSGYSVTYVQNFTDIDDKIIARARSLNQPPLSLAERYINDYFEKMSRLNVQRADHYPRVSTAMREIVKFIEGLVEKGLAYVLDGDVYFQVRSFKGYGKLSKRSLNDMEPGARVEVDERKRDPLDFALWKTAKPGEPSWGSPWGDGRPGWHIECSVMSILHLGESFDIHGGGQDLVFPHHENEIAQSEGLTGKPLAKYWIHNGFVTVNREKMSKSLGNFFTLKEIFAKVSPEVVRFFLLSRHYRTPLDFSDDLLMQAASAYHNLREINDMCFFLLRQERPSGVMLAEWKDQFMTAMSDDFNTEKAIAVLFQLRNRMVEKVREGDLDWLKKAWHTLRHACVDVLGVPLESRLTLGLVDDLKAKLARREESRKKKDWKTADILREEAAAVGYLVEDTPSGPVIKPRPDFS